MGGLRLSPIYRPLTILWYPTRLLAGCPLYSWQCNNGQCIKSDELCDGNYDCEDKSDETVEECLLRPCPSYAFQCAYGACITGNFKCNGVVNCVDGSDETRFLCNSKVNYEKELQGSCVFPTSMECQSGECISNDKLCDGHEDCLDGSDEIVQVCSFLKCPEYSFRCGYGACVPGLSACNGIKDCRDGSDEIASICSNITITMPTSVRPEPEVTTSTTTTTTTTTISTSTTIYPDTTPKPTISENYCSSSIITRGISSLATCYYDNKPVSCKDHLRVGTVANITCAPGYIEKQMKKSVTSIKCDTDGEWTRSKTKCMPDCGTLTDDQKNKVTKPWDVTILRRDYVPIYDPICSGVIVSPKIVLTAANCLRIRNSDYNTDHVYYSLVQGFYNQSYAEGYHTSNADIHNISSISIKNMHRTQDLAVLVVVNYFQFSHNLKPICLPTAQSNIFPFYSDNKLNIGRPVIRDTSRIYLEYLIASLETKSNGRNALTYVNVFNYIPFINREIKKYDYLL
ncbi:hypothetical protein FF38_07208 [Lucilia cuprina]|uniref:Sushi domain-containing protein n=1 Tax=Lucilia cuprina TaxID=7375 RepID=A0A0L0CL16_LUCCU|nr:hypothetical protein FF38_07208 [Lucilia cuprina]